MLLQIVASDQISSKQSDCAGFGPHGRFCDTRLAETSQYLELLRIDTLSDTRTTLKHIKHLTLGRAECIAFSILVSAIVEISDCDYNSEHILRWVIKRLDLRAVRLGDILLHLLAGLHQRLCLRVQRYLLRQRPLERLLLVLVVRV